MGETSGDSEGRVQGQGETSQRRSQEKETRIVGKHIHTYSNSSDMFDVMDV